MTLKVLVASSEIDLSYLLPAFGEFHPGMEAVMECAAYQPSAIDAVLCFKPAPGLIASLPNLRLVQSTGAGVDHILADTSIPASLPICRVVDPNMANGMAGYVAWAITYRHRNFDVYLTRSQKNGVWREEPIVPMGAHRVGIAGLGALGASTARALVALGYDVAGWSRTPKDNMPDGVTCYYGKEQLPSFLARSDCLVCLLPLTDETRGFLCRALFENLPRGAHVINVGRGEHLIEDDLLGALADGHLGAATLDVFSREPLPPTHAFWRHPRIVVTPHIATRTQPAIIVSQLARNLENSATGKPLVGLVERERGY